MQGDKKCEEGKEVARTSTGEGPEASKANLLPESCKLSERWVATKLKKEMGPNVGIHLIAKYQ